MRIGILGATGAVGRQMITSLEERQIVPEELRLFASERSAGKELNFFEKGIPLEVITKDRLLGLDYVLGAVSNPLAKEWGPVIQEAGGVFIDNSSAYRLDEDVPLVVPEVNGEDALNHHGIIANPNCSTIITMMAVSPIQKISPIKKMITSTYQAVSGAGIGGLNELTNQVNDIREGKELTSEIFPKQIAYNCIPLIGSLNENGYTTEEMKMQNEGRKILHNHMDVSCTCVRVPVYRSHAICVSLQCEKELGIEEVNEALDKTPGILHDSDHFPTPLETSNQDLVAVGRIRKDLVFDGGISLWCCGDQIRKGAATNAIQILEYLLAH